MSEAPLVLFCRNDPQDGAPTDRVTGIELHHGADVVFELEGDAEFRFSEQPPGVRIDGEWFDAASVLHPWVGNWCWDGARMPVAQIVALFNHLRRLGWDCDCASAALFDAWEAGRDLTVGELLGELEEA
jgi:hypothetical protein